MKPKVTVSQYPAPSLDARDAVTKLSKLSYLTRLGGWGLWGSSGLRDGPFNLGERRGGILVLISRNLFLL